VSSRIERLIQNYERFCSLPWEQSLSGAERVWFAVYDKADERRLRARITEFELASKRAGHNWCLIDLTNTFGRWLAEQDYHESFFENPEDLEPLLPDFEARVVELISKELTASDSDENRIIAVMGIAGLFGFLKVSGVIPKIASRIRGRLLVFFPGEYDDGNYRLLDARDGWNYRAIPITANNGTEA